jgi:hypothetical protein
MREVERKRQVPTEREAADDRLLNSKEVQEASYIRDGQDLGILVRVLGAVRLAVTPHIPVD